MSRQIQIALVEDDFVIAKDLEMSLQNIGYNVKHVYDNGEDFLKGVSKHKPDLALLDIQLAGKMDGIDVAEVLSNKHHLPFVFLTAQDDLLTLERAKFTEPQAYLIKPINITELQATIEIALYKCTKPTQNTDNQTNKPSNEDKFIKDHLFIRHKNRLEKICLHEILWIEAKDIYAVIKTKDKQLVASQSLKSIEGNLNENFMRIHRSYVVALNKIEAIEDNSLIIGGQYISIGKTYKNQLLNKLKII